MKRAVLIFQTLSSVTLLSVTLLSVTLVLIPALPARAQSGHAQAVELWVNQLRGQRGLPALQLDPFLRRAAADYGRELAGAGVLSHVDQRGGRALDRLHAHGDTASLVGEILGSGADLQLLIPAWENSLSHRDVLANPLWTHCGAAAVPHADTMIWVILFASRRIDPLDISASKDGYRVCGRLRSLEAEEPVLLSGTRNIVPQRWDPPTREFCFIIPAERGAIYHRLGYRSEGGALVVTDTFFPDRYATSDRAEELR